MKTTTLLSTIFLGIFLFVSHSVFGVIAYPHPVSITQPDGRIITIILKGDEKVKWAETLDGFTVLSNSEGYYEYATLDSKGNMIPSGVVASTSLERTTEEIELLNKTPKKLRFSKEQISIMKQIWQVKQKESSKAFPTTGDRKLLCILIGFSDLAFTKTQADFNALFNQVGYSFGGATGSVKDYYLENSYNQFNLTVDVAGPYTASQNMAYYGANDSWGDDIRPRELVTEAVNLANPDVNYAEYDNDNDGYVDAIYVIYAGYGEEAGGGANAIWAHAWSLYPAVYLDGKYIQSYSCSAELRGNYGSTITAIGVICHEFGHVLGAPDYYDTNYETGGQFDGTGEWDMMAGGSWNNNGVTPAHHNGFTKVYYYNWAEATELNSSTSVTLLNSAQNSNSFYRINTTTNNEFFLVENREKHLFDAHIPGSGMIIYHVHSGVFSAGSSNNINATHPQKMYPVSQNATMDPTSSPASYGNINSATCAWTGTGKTSFTDATLPSSKSWAGSNTNKPITNISRNASAKTVSFDFMGGAAGNPTNFVAMAQGSTQILLSWIKNSGNDVMLVYSTSNTFGTPATGVNYSVGQSVTGGGVVLYVGGNQSYTHSNLSPNTTYFYKIFSKLSSTPTWSTGVETNASTDCDAISSLPLSENFNASNALPGCWSIVDHQGNGQVWAFGTHSNGLSGTTGNYAYLNSDAYGSGNTQNADLVTPLLNLSNYTDVTLSFKHYFYEYTGSSAKLSYSIDGGSNWVQIQQWTSSTANPATFNQAIPQVNGQALVKFKWNYTGSWGYFWDVDDVSITGTMTSTPTLPTVTTTAISSITASTATSGGNVTSDGGAAVTARGVAWSTNQNPTINDSYTINGTGAGTYTSNITNLSPNTLYYVRAYATNSVGTAYGNQLSFTTSESSQNYSVTFNVDMNNVSDFNPNTDLVYLTGSFTDWAMPGTPGSIQMSLVENTNGVPFNFFESFEGFEDFTTDLSPWTTYQLTSGNTWSDSGFDFPGEGTEFAFMVFNPSQTTPPIDNNQPAFIGDKYAVAVQYQGLNDNKWLISPQIAINHTSVLSFWAKTMIGYGMERFKVMVSTTGTEPTDFAQISPGNHTETPNVWTQFTYDLSAFAGQTVHIGINYVSYDAFCFMLDAFEVTAQTEVPDQLIYTATVEIEAGIHEYKYFLNSGWANGEWDGEPNRSINISSNMTVNDTWGVMDQVSLCEALDNCDLTFTTGGDASWNGQTAVSNDGVDAARSGEITHNQQTWMETTVQGPGQLSFWWRVSSEPNFDFLVFYINDTQEAIVSGDTDWAQFEYTIPNGSHTLRWVYIKDGSVNMHMDCGFVDQIVYTTETNTTPSVSTVTVTSITQTTATSGGNVTSDGGATVSARGVVWSTSQNPTLDSNLGYTVNGSGTGVYSSQISSLSPETTYYVRAYATNSVGTAYGNQLNFTTLAEVAVSLCEAVDNCNLTFTTGGNASWYGQTYVTHDGVDAARSGDINHSQQTWMQTTIQGPGLLYFWWKVSSESTFDILSVTMNDAQLAQISGEIDWEQKEFLIPVGNHTIKWMYEKDGTVNSGFDCGFVDQVEFKPLPTVTTNDISSITQTTATSGGNVTSGGGLTVTSRGIVWGISQDPTLDSNMGMTVNGSGLGQFTSNLTNLSPQTTYYVRAYASNSNGTIYGNQVSFSTLATGANIEELSHIAVYPNPFIDKIQIISEFDIIKLTINNMKGQKIIEKQFDGIERITLDVSELPKGAYLLTVLDKDGNNRTTKLVK